MDNRERRMWKVFVRLFLLILSALATVKIVFLGTDVDEQYAVTMAYRMACGDRMFMEMWEPHQTSGFLAAFLIKIFMLVTGGGVDGLVIYLRLAGVVFQGSVSLFLYDTMKRYCSGDTAFLAAVFFYNTLPKYSQIPEFANMLVWFSVMMFLCLMRFFMKAGGKRIWLVLAGICMSLLVLSYPSCLLAVFPVCFGIWHLGAGRERLISEAWFLGSCAVCGLGYLLHFLSHMTVEEFIFGISQMMSDGSHSDTLSDKLAIYGGDMVRLMPHILIVLALALGLWALFKYIVKRELSFILSVLFISVAEQMYVWLTKDYYLKFPLLIYPILVLIGLCRYRRREKYGIDRESRAYQAAFWFGSITAVWILLAAFIASNVHIFESSEYMMIGMVASFGYLEYERKNTSVCWGLVTLALLCAVMFRKGYLMYYFYGKETVFVTKQKALDGPLAGVYCRYSDGYDYNMKGLVIDQYIPEGSTVMYVGIETLIYLQGGYDISNFSTISTPVMDERLFEYWEKYPEKYPEYVIWDFEIPSMFRPNAEVKERMLRHGELLAEDEGIQIYRIHREDRMY